MTKTVDNYGCRGDNVTDDECRGSFDRGFIGQAGDGVQGPFNGALIGQRGIVDQRSRAGTANCPRENRRYLGEVGERHEYHEGVRGPGQVGQAIRVSASLGGRDSNG